MKYLKYFSLMAVAVISLSLVTERTSRLSDGISPGNPIPDIEDLENLSGTTINLSDLRGQKVLVNFWAAYDANSRRDNILFSKITEQQDSSIRMVSVSFDRSKSVFEKTVVMDEIDTDNQYYAQANIHPKLVELYKSGKGIKNYLLDEKGIILDVDLTPEDLSQHLSRN